MRGGVKYLGGGVLCLFVAGEGLKVSRGGCRRGLVEGRALMW